MTSLDLKLKYKKWEEQNCKISCPTRTYEQGPSVGELTAIHANKLATKLRIAWPGIYSMSQCATLVTLEE